MKLPEDKNERMKILALIGVGVIAVVIVIVMFVIKPMLAGKEAKKARIIELRENIEKADREIALMQRDKEENVQALRTTKELSDKYFLKPSLGGNYQLSAQEIIEKHAQALGFTELPTTREVGMSDIILAPGERQSSVGGYSSRISLNCSYKDLIAFLRALEASNPLMCITSVSISGQATPEIHSISFDVQWPIWKDQVMIEQLQAKLAAAEADIGQERK